MSKVIGICNLHDDPSLGLLTETRPCGAVTFLGRYGLADFTLSNFSNSNIDRVYVLAKYGVLSMKSHIGNGSVWTNNTRRGYVQLVHNEALFATPNFNTDVANIRANLGIDELDFDYAVIAPSCMIACIDYLPIIKAHEEGGADLTIVYAHMSGTEEDLIYCDRLKIGANNRILKIDTNLGKTDEADISLQSFIISKKLLKRILVETPKVSELFSVRDMLRKYVNEGEIDARAYKFEGFVAPILSLEHYVKHSLNLLNYRVRGQLFHDDWPIYTTTHNTPPALYGKHAKVRKSFIANGSIIKGTVEDSIISRDVVVEKGAVVTNCIIFSKSTIGKDVRIDYVVTDKGVKITTVKELKGEANKPVYVRQGAKI